jgi:uncharacterized membrane protein YkvA (DUF1232 family)
MKWLDRLKERARKLQRDTFALWFAYKDKRTPLRAKIVAALVTAYAFSPIDLIPDFIPVLGYLDDLILIPAGIALAVKWIPVEVMADARKTAEAHLAEKKPVNWLVAMIIILVWLAIIAAIVLAIWRPFRPT